MNRNPAFMINCSTAALNNARFMREAIRHWDGEDENESAEEDNWQSCQLSRQVEKENEDTEEQLNIGVAVCIVVLGGMLSAITILVCNSLSGF